MLSSNAYKIPFTIRTQEKFENGTFTVETYQMVSLRPQYAEMKPWPRKSNDFQGPVVQSPIKLTPN